MPQPPQPVTSQGYGFDHARQTAFAFESLLRQHGITIRAGSQLEQATLSVLDVLYYKEVGGQRDLDDIRPKFRDMIGLTELGGLVLSVKNHPSFRSLLKHLALLNDGVALQNLPSPERDQATNKVFELWAATLAMHCGSDVELDDPFHSAGDNPDVLVTVSGRRWGIACKVIHTLQPESFIQNLDKGLAQIDASSAEVGVVIFNLKNVLRHEEYWTITNPERWTKGDAPQFGAFIDPDVPFQRLVRETQQVGVRLREHVGPEYLKKTFTNRRSVPGFLLWSHTVSGIRLNDRPVVTSVRIMNLQSQRALTKRDSAVLQCFHEAAFADQPKPHVA